METPCKITQRKLKNRSSGKHKKSLKQPDLKIGQLVFVKIIKKVHSIQLTLTVIRVSEILNDSTVMFTTPDGKERNCNIHYIKPMTPVEASTNAFNQFQDSIKKTPCNTSCHQYNLRSKIKLYLKFSVPCRTLKPLLCMYITALTNSQPPNIKIHLHNNNKFKSLATTMNTNLNAKGFSSNH